ncbi:MAG: hypothetical protein OYH76_11730 [Defluviicoccus sp.]|nr:hypothetical protein [Defluviicoccus sp.]MDE0276556.1 hypothetical protein [Defluviicoccus sp.]
MSPKQILAIHIALFGIYVGGFSALWIGMQQMSSDIRAEISDVRTELSAVAQRVARIEARLGIPAATPADRAAADPETPPPPRDSSQPTVDG